MIKCGKCDARFEGECPWLHALRRVLEGYIVAGRQFHMRRVRVDLCMIGVQCIAALHKLGQSVNCTVSAAAMAQQGEGIYW